MCYILCTTRHSVYYVASDAWGGLRNFLPRKCVTFFASFFVSIVGWFFGTWFFVDGFLFLVKELGLLTNPGHWVRVLDVAGSYMYIVL
jgi:hypothetical protein